MPVQGRVTNPFQNDEFDRSIFTVEPYSIAGPYFVAGQVSERAHQNPPPAAGVIGTVPGGGGLGPKPPRLSGMSSQKH